MNDDFTSDALQFLLGEMEPARRAAFADQLARDPVAAAAFKTCADSYARFAVDVASPPPLSEGERRASLAAILASTSVHPAAARVPVSRFPQWLWPAAAAILLLITIVQGIFLSRAKPPEAPVPETNLATTSPLPDAGVHPAHPPLPVTRGAATHHSAAPSAATESLSTPGSAVLRGVAVVDNTPAALGSSDHISNDLTRLDNLRHEYVLLQRAREALNTEYNLALEQLTRRALTEQGVGRLAAMELVDADSYARGDRRGLINLARGLLTEQGIVAVEPSTVQTSLETLGVRSSSINISPGDVPSQTTPSFSSSNASSDVLSSGARGEVVSFNSTTQPGNTYAWSVFDEKQNQGYLNLYNLPQVSAAHSLQVWVKPVDSAEFRTVGEVPAQFYGKSGSIHYQLPSTVATPAEIMITLEPRTATPVNKPTGPVLLRGP